MQKSKLARPIVAGLAACLVSASLLVGCGGNDAPNNAPNNEPPKAAAPAKPPRGEVATAPSMTFKFGNEEAKVYELTGIDLKDLIRTGKIVTMGDDIFFHTDSSREEDKKSHTRKVTMKNETITNLVDLGPSGDIDELATNGKVTIWETGVGGEDKNKLVIYDGKEAKVSGKWHSLLVGEPGSDEFWYIRGDDLIVAKLSDGDLTEPKVVIKGMSNLPGYDSAGLKPICIDQGEIYIRRVTKAEGKYSHVLVAFDKNGKELRQYEGLTELPRGWAVTENYVIHTGSKGDFRVFDRKTGEVIGDAKIEMRPFALWTKTGNDVIVYDDRADKLYRIDF